MFTISSKNEYKKTCSLNSVQSALKSHTFLGNPVSISYLHIYLLSNWLSIHLYTIVSNIYPYIFLSTNLTLYVSVHPPNHLSLQRGGEGKPHPYCLHPAIYSQTLSFGNALTCSAFFAAPLYLLLNAYYTVNPRYMNTQQECMKCRLETYFDIYDSGYAFSLVCTKRMLLRCSQLQRVEYDL